MTSHLLPELKRSIATPARVWHPLFMTKTEENILVRVRDINGRGALAGLGTSPTNTEYKNPEFRFVKRLADAGLIVWVPWTSKYGAGWAIPEYVPDYISRSKS